MNKKKYYYVLVMTKNGPVFVTGTEGRNYAKWEKDKKPMLMSKEYAEDMHYGLTCNCFTNYLIEETWEIDSQPYLYEYGKLYWRKKRKKEE